MVGWRDGRVNFRMRRILLVVEPGVDGVFRHVEALSHFLWAKGFGVDLAYSDVRKSDRLFTLVDQVVANGGQVLNLRVGNSPGPGDVRAFLNLVRFVRRRRPDVIHAHSSKAGGLARAMALLRIPGVYFYTPHAYFGMSGKGGAKTWFFNQVERFLSRCGTSINLSDGEVAFAREQLGIAATRQVLIPNPVDTTIFRPVDPAARTRLKSELGLPGDAIILGSVGRLAFQKDPLTLYRAVAPVLQRDPRLHLYHLGQGELSDDCRALATELGIGHRIIRKDYLSNPACFYQTIDAMILTSRYEGLSFAVLEALACHLPVLLSDVPGNRDFFKLGLSHCWSAPMEQPLPFTKAIEAWLADRKAARPCNHRTVAETKFSQEACFGAIVHEYSAALAVRGNPFSSVVSAPVSGAVSQP